MTGAVKQQRGTLAGLRVLVVDDEPDVRLGLQRLMERLGCSVDTAGDGREALERFEAARADLVLTDLSMPRMGGAELLTELKRRAPATDVLILTGFGTVQNAVACMQAGACHFLTKPFDNEEVLEVVARRGRQVLAARHPGGGEAAPVAADARTRRLFEFVERVAVSPVPVLIQGESGAGKEVVARMLHRLSPRAERPFLALNATAVPDTLLESELFGHRKGSFTGADRDRRGIFEQACGGTVFLDEIASMSLSFQGKLLRVLEHKVVRPLGSSDDVPVDFRLVAATHCDLEPLIRRGEFREDLFYRLRVVTVPIPPLRERPADIPILAAHFLRRAAAVSLPDGTPVPELSPEALAALQAHAWPGNVRELENALHRAVVVCWGDRILPHHLGLQDAAGGSSPPADGLDYDAAKKQAVERFQREFVQRALERSRGNVSRAAEACGLTRAAFQRIMRALGIDRERYLPR